MTGVYGPFARKPVRDTRAGDVDVFDLTIETTHASFAGSVLARNY